MTGSTSGQRARRTAMAILGGALLLIGIRIATPAIAAPVTAENRPAPAPVARPAARPMKAAPTPTPTPAPTAAPLVIKRVIDTGGAIRYGSYFWDASAVPDGPLTITVDLKASVLSVFRGGYEIGTTAVIYGADHKPTPLGTFPILQKDRRHFSSRYHHAPMPYTLRLTGDGVSIHASEIAANYTTHGCVGVPTGFAHKLFEVARTGDRVVITNVGLSGGKTA